MSVYIYLHGFASSPQSTKARYLRDRCQEIGLDLMILDLNQGDFAHLTLTRQLQQVEELINSSSEPITLIGSSFGGLTAAWLGQRNLRVQRLLLLAPAFNFLQHWLPKLSQVQLQQWQDSGYLPVYHYGEKQIIPLHYEFVRDAHQYHEQQLQRPLPTLILHGIHDEVIPVQASRDYAYSRSWVKLRELDSDHSLADVLPQIWQTIVTYQDYPVR